MATLGATQLPTVSRLLVRITCREKKVMLPVRWILPLLILTHLMLGCDSTDARYKCDTSLFSGVEEQPSESERYGDLEGGLSTYGVVKRKRDNDMELHSNKQVCGE